MLGSDIHKYILRLGFCLCIWQRAELGTCVFYGRHPFYGRHVPLKRKTYISSSKSWADTKSNHFQQHLRNLWKAPFKKRRQPFRPKGPDCPALAESLNSIVIQFESKLWTYSYNPLILGCWVCSVRTKGKFWRSWPMQSEPIFVGIYHCYCTIYSCFSTWGHFFVPTIFDLERSWVEGSRSTQSFLEI